MTILETAALIFLVGCLVCVALVVGLIHLSEWLRIRRKLRNARMVSGHPRIEHDAVFIAQQQRKER